MALFRMYKGNMVNSGIYYLGTGSEGDDGVGRGVHE